MAYVLQLLAFCCFLIPVTSSYSQTPTSAAPDTISFVFGVFDKSGEPVLSLKQEQLNITDNGQPAEVVTLQPSTQIPLRLGILIDSSRSSRSYLGAEKQAATFLAEHVAHSASDRAFVLAFDQVWDLVQDFTNDAGGLTQKIDDIRPGGGTAVWDVLYYACRDKLKGQPIDGPGRRVIILFYDGHDNMSHVTRDEAFKMALRAGVIIYIIAPEANRAEDMLRELAVNTGGDAFFPRKPGEWAIAVNHIQGDLQNQYLVTYKQTAPATNAEFHNLKIEVNDPTLMVRSAQGYFSRKP